MMTLYRSSITIADTAYAAKKNLEEIIHNSYDALNETKRQMQYMFEKTKERIPQNERKKIHEELAQLKLLKTKMYSTIEGQQQEKNTFQQQVRQFNNNTHYIKEYIRDNCGRGGAIWYQRLMERRNG